MSLLNATLATLRTMRPTVLAVLLVVTIGTNLLDFATVPPAGARAGAGFLFAAIVRIVGVFWVSYTLQRDLAGGARPFRPSVALARFALLQLVLLAFMGLVRALAQVALGPGAAPLATQWLHAFLAMAFVALVTARLLAWNAALAMGEPFGALGAVWRRQDGRALAIVGVVAGLILPVAAVHLALTLVVVRVPLGAGAMVTLGVIDGIVQALQLGLTTALGAAAWRIARPIEAAASAR